MFASLESCDRVLIVEIIAGKNGDHIDVLIVEGLFLLCGVFGDLKLCGSRLNSLLRQVAYRRNGNRWET